ncbi:MAG: substrate-binding periplasmic protein [Sphingomonadaceae bacterium]
MKWKHFLCWIVWMAVSQAQAQPETVIYPGAISSDQRTGYYAAVLDLALKKSGTPYRLQASGQMMVAPRLMQQLQDRDGINVCWWPTSPELEQRLLPVRIPIDKGILGWRLFLIRKDDRARFAAIHTLPQLQALVAGQQRDWSDTAILRANGIKVVGAGLYPPMFQMLASGRFHYFPRGVGEIWNEERQHGGLGLEVEGHLALHYPVHTYFFVNKHDTALAQRLEHGLRTALKDGSFDALFEQYNGEFLRRARLGSRTVFELHNPLTTPAPRQGKTGGLHLSTAPLSSED